MNFFVCGRCMRTCPPLSGVKEIDICALVARPVWWYQTLNSYFLTRRWLSLLFAEPYQLSCFSRLTLGLSWQHPTVYLVYCTSCLRFTVTSASQQLPIMMGVPAVKTTQLELSPLQKYFSYDGFIRQKQTIGLRIPGVVGVSGKFMYRVLLQSSSQMYHLVLVILVITSCLVLYLISCILCIYKDTERVRMWVLGRLNLRVTFLLQLFTLCSFLD